MIQKKNKISKKKKLNLIKNYFNKFGILKFLKGERNSFKPDLLDLFRIHQFIILNKRITALEFGCGWSTFIIKHALSLNKNKYLQDVRRFRKKTHLSYLQLIIRKNF